MEDSDGNLVKTLMLCHLAGGQDRWLNSLTAWYAAGGGSDTTTEGTKPAGSYDCTWDCTDTSGKRVEAGTYNFCVEAAVEHGNEVVVAGKQTLGSAAIDADLGISGELSTVHVKYTA
ncbi:MAG: DUF2271 domain-containing protein [Luteococcus sp.]|uniref:DUF2271 domain-containing protein n=1 Tax=Luteococcus sp. TaxID=1969402 RepID=UPI0026499081|nr:DUF2271 domain-containing protein [Luteococcus sp.]MDN5564954.1 DUF2271 domain-containing protein [Luteococcus sp.]